MLGLLLAIVLAADLTPKNGADPCFYRERPAVHIWSTDWYWTDPQPAVKTLAFKGLIADHAGQQLAVCVRSAHDNPGTINVWSARFVDSVEIPHGRALRTRCGVVTVVNWPSSKYGAVVVSEGTYVRDVADEFVHGWVRNVSIRAVS